MNEEIERLAHQMAKLEQGDKPVTDNVMRHYLGQASLAHRAMQAIEKEDATAHTVSQSSPGQ